jgi:hypothetical protein
MDTPWSFSSDPDIQQKTSAMQGELIHTFWGYHSHRLRNGFPFALGNFLRDKISAKVSAANDVSDGPNPSAFKRSLLESGYMNFNLIDAVRSAPDQRAVTMIANGIIASMWDSLNHVTGFFTENVPPQYADFIADDDLRTLRVEMDILGKHQSAFSGSRTVHAGAKVGVQTMTFLSALEYGLPVGHPFDAKDIAFMLSKTDSPHLSMLMMDRAILNIMPTREHLSSFHDVNAPSGFPAERLKNHCVPDALGCSARAKIGDTATTILQRHELYSPTYDDAEKQSAIKLIAEQVRQFFFQQIDILLKELSPDEQSVQLCETDRLLLQHSEPAH